MFIDVSLICRGIVMLEAISQVNHEGKSAFPMAKARALSRYGQRDQERKTQVLLLSEYDGGEN